MLGITNIKEFEKKLSDILREINPIRLNKRSRKSYSGLITDGFKIPLLT